MADTIRDRYQRAMSVPSPDASVRLARALGTAPQQGGMGQMGQMINPQMLKVLAEYFANNKQVDPATAQAKWGQAMDRMPGAAAGPAVPPNVMPPMQAMTTEPTPQFQQDPSRQQNYGAPGGPQPMQPPPMPPPQAIAGAPDPMQAQTQPMTTEPPMSGLQGLIEAMSKKKAAPWTVNEGNYADQYGGSAMGGMGGGMFGGSS